MMNPNNISGSDTFDAMAQIGEMVLVRISG